MKMEPSKSFVAGKSLRDLGYALRHPETWPPGFEFDYLYEDTCARGLAHALGMVPEPTTVAMAESFGISVKDARRLFNADYGLAYIGRVVVTAADVADRIDAHLAKQA